MLAIGRDFIMQDFFTRTVAFVWLVTVGMVVSNCALAIEPANLRAGPVYFTPSLETETRYVDNVFRSTNNEVDSWVLEVTPKVQAWMQNGINTYSLSYQLQDTRYSDTHDDDFTDQQLNLDIHHEFTAKNALNFFGEYYDGHEERGTGLSEGGISALIDKPVEYELATWGGDYTYGNTDSRGRLELAAKTADYQYQNFREFTRFRDRDQDIYSGTYFWKVAQRTDILAQIRNIRNRYDQTNPSDVAGSLDSKEYNYLLGISWEATARTSGSVKVGWYDREYDSAGRKDSDGFQWEVDLIYKPRTYSTVNLASRRFSRETNGLGDFIDTSETEVTWDHYWSSRGSSHLSIMYATDDYSQSPRDDDRGQAEFSYSYQFKRWFDVGAGYRRERRDSSVRSLDYEYNVYFIEAELSL